MTNSVPRYREQREHKHAHDITGRTLFLLRQDHDVICKDLAKVKSWGTIIIQAMAKVRIMMTTTKLESADAEITALNTNFLIFFLIIN